jgi:hypothetical protein
MQSDSEFETGGAEPSNRRGGPCRACCVSATIRMWHRLRPRLCVRRARVVPRWRVGHATGGPRNAASSGTRTLRTAQSRRVAPARAPAARPRANGRTGLLSASTKPRVVLTQRRRDRSTRPRHPTPSSTSARCAHPSHGRRDGSTRPRHPTPSSTSARCAHPSHEVPSLNPHLALLPYPGCAPLPPVLYDCVSFAVITSREGAPSRS